MRLCGCQDDEAGNVLSSLMGVVSLMCWCYTSLFLGSAAACCLFLLLLSNPAALLVPGCHAAQPAVIHGLLGQPALRTYLQYLQFALLTSDHISHWDNFTTTGITLLSGPAAGYTIHDTI